MLGKLRFVARLLGYGGLLLCVTAAVGVWYLQSQLQHASEQIFARTEQSCDRIGYRLGKARQTVVATRSDLETIQQHLADATIADAQQRLVSRSYVVATLDRLIADMPQAGLLLDAARDAILHIKETLELAAGMGLPLPAGLVDPLLEPLADIAKRLANAAELVETLRQRIGAVEQRDEAREFAEEAARLAAGLLLTCGEVDTLLATSQARVADVQDALTRRSAKLHAQIFAVAVSLTLLLMWMAAGQMCLCRHACGG